MYSGAWRSLFLQSMRTVQKMSLNLAIGLRTGWRLKKACDSFRDFCSRINKSISARERSKTLSQRHKMTVSCSKSCKKITTARNKLAHCADMTKREIFEALQEIHSLLKAFGLRCESTLSVLKTLKNLPFNQNHVVYEVKKHEGDEQCSSKKRILRPKVGSFVGRKQELQLIQHRLCFSESGRRRTVVIFGPAGIGKSYLANKVVCELRTKHPKQRWLCCTRETYVREDLSSIFQKIPRHQLNKLEETDKVKGLELTKKTRRGRRFWTVSDPKQRSCP